MKKLCKRGLCLILIFSLVNIHSPILEASTTGKTEISYDGIVVENNSNVNDYIQFKNLNYINEEDKTTNCTITLYKDKEKLVNSNHPLLVIQILGEKIIRGI